MGDCTFGIVFSCIVTCNTVPLGPQQAGSIKGGKDKIASPVEITPPVDITP